MMVENLKEILAMHLEWLNSNHEKGKQADFKNANLEKVDLYGAFLEQAIF
ncbi:MAG: pentapeptide repeat-containing protein [SAR324 cluster bacterium]|nr:pentapeptide repeat-containing protein [SAR324 cluster bacterium]